MTRAPVALLLALLMLGAIGSARAVAADLRLHSSLLPALDVEALSEIIEEETGIRLVRVEPDEDPLRALAQESADLAIVENTRPFTPGLRTVLPLYKGVVHMASADAFDWEGSIAAGRGPRIEFAGAAHTGRMVADLMFARARDARWQYEPWDPGSGVPPDFTFYVGPLLPEKTEWLRPGFSLVSLDRIDAAGAEFYSEGISYLVPQLSPAKIPALTYSLPGNETSIDALAVDMLLLTQRGENTARIYRLVEVLLEQKARFAAREPQLFRWLTEDFDESQLNFPLHQGTRDYLAREDPGFLERYAETFNFIVYLVALMVTGLVGLGRWRNRARKDRIDRFYERLMELRGRVGQDADRDILAAINQLESDAFELLVRERLSADESFRIFMELAAGLRRELELRGAR